MPHLYECAQCRTRGPARRDHRDDARADRDDHRDRAHGGHAPIDGDRIRTVHNDARGDGLLPRHTGIAMLVLLFLILASCWGR
ncbi:hypothetical protein [Streptomyces sp. NPDC047070]|uniref:hypothetical protein n=1 Tax=Streptomyces sp. NPDC047070 TaxID=3154923 RepID=UPI003452FD78